MSLKIIERASEVITQNTVNGGDYMGQYCVLALVDLERYLLKISKLKTRK
ncbi:MAG: hypothetical protein FWG98_10570 [Candidatus Cloacimonetes bacterium]|nr:hypothetical protein [Candidatus Cloacimonadota bacterium]